MAEQAAHVLPKRRPRPSDTRPSSPGGEEYGPRALRGRVDQALADFLDRRFADLLDMSPGLGAACDALRDFVLAGGKRLRPAFCYWGWRGAGGAADSDDIVHAAAALELLHGSGLIHDDMIDASDFRRGKPAVHRRFADSHREQRLAGDPEAFGTSIALLLGDLLMAWCARMFDECRLPAHDVRAAKSLFHLMHTEVLAGQYLDVYEPLLDTVSAQRTSMIMRYKTAKYTVERPLQLGGRLAGAGEDLLDAYSRFALPLGEAFQLRDDLLGVFGDPERTGKPAGDDLREGKHTMLIALAMEHAGAAERAELGRRLGDPELSGADIDIMRSIITTTGARGQVEALIAENTATALDVLATMPIDEAARSALADLVLGATQRTG